jgi:ribonuclease E
MTPQEQEVYALMGVSPLVRLEREFKDPKSVIVLLKAPGETEPTQEEITPSVTDSVTDPVIDPVIAPHPVTDYDESNTEMAMDMELDSNNETEELENGRPITRRRRRRSSAREIQTAEV